MDNIESEVEQAIARISLAPEVFERVSVDVAAAVVAELERSFLKGRASPMWLGLAGKPVCVRYAKSGWVDCLLGALDRVQASEGWLVFESDSSALPVYRFRGPRELVQLLSECSFIEYYVVDPRFQWLIVDTDHNELLILE